MAIILDADVIIRGEKGSFGLKAWVASRPNDEFEVAAITMAELGHAVERATGPHEAKSLRYLQTLLTGLPIVPYAAQTALHHARIWAELESVGKRVWVLTTSLLPQRLWNEEAISRHSTNAISVSCRG